LIQAITQKTINGNKVTLEAAIMLIKQDCIS
jgi:hypothetical protein